MTEITPERLAQIKARADAVTAGPWHADGMPHNRIIWSDHGNMVCFMTHSNGFDTARDIATSEFVAAARQDIPDLIAALKAAQAQTELERERCAALLDRYENGLAQVWRHKKTGGMYRIINHVRIEANNTAAVAYTSVDGGAIWVRPLTEFNDGRFEKVEDATVVALEQKP